MFSLIKFFQKEFKNVLFLVFHNSLNSLFTKEKYSTVLCYLCFYIFLNCQSTKQSTVPYAVWRNSFCKKITKGENQLLTLVPLSSFICRPFLGNQHKILAKKKDNGNFAVATKHHHHFIFWSCQKGDSCSYFLCTEKFSVLHSTWPSASCTTNSGGWRIFSEHHRGIL